MKLRKQSAAKAAIMAATAGLMLLFYSAVRADPRIKADDSPGTPPIDYDHFFAPPSPSSSADQIPSESPRIRTRAS